MAAIAACTTRIVESGVASVVFARDGDTLYIAYSDGRLVEYDAMRGRENCSWHLAQGLTSLSLSEDGQILLIAATDSVYRLDLAAGSVSVLDCEGPFHDIQFVGDGRAIASGGDFLLLDVQAGSVAAIDSFTDFRAERAIIVDDGPLSLIAEWGTSNGELAIWDETTGAVIARTGNDGGTVAPGYNFGHTAISSEAGLVLQFSYYGLVNAYDLALAPLGVFELGERVDGLAFDPDGTHFYAYLIGSGILAEFDAATFERTGEAEIGISNWHNNARSGDQIAFSADGSLMTVLDGYDGTLTVIEVSAALPEGGAGRDYHRGTMLADTFRGFAGDDTFLVRNPGDTAIELPGEGTDTIIARIDLALPDNIENLRLAGRASTGTGNALDNDIRAGRIAATLHGHEGNDILRGGPGDDVLFGEDGADRLIGSSGHDDMHGGPGDDYLAGAAGRDRLYGGDGDDVLKSGSGRDMVDGGAGDDVIFGGAGIDIMAGGSGADTFVFWKDMARASALPNRADYLLDFSSLEGDTIDLTGVDADRTVPGDQAFDWIGKADFSGRPGELRAQVDEGFTLVEADTDGDRIADFAIKLMGYHDLSAADFLL